MLLQQKEMFVVLDGETGASRARHRESLFGAGEHLHGKLGPVLDPTFYERYEPLESKRKVKFRKHDL